MVEDLREVVPVETSDGSMTLFDRERSIHYRSRHGAMSESRHVFLEGTGLIDREGPWRVVELGFGAAVNFAQTVKAFREARSVSRLIYHSVDWRVVTPDHLRFHEGEGGKLAREAAALVHGKNDGDEVVSVESDDGRVELNLYPRGWERAKVEGVSAQAYFHDPFAINVNPEAWTAAYFRWAKARMDDDGKLSTYSAATAVKRAMFAAGLSVASAPGPGRKREMTVASPSREVLEGTPGLVLLKRSRYVGEDR